jgi:hypothetical protein
MIERTLDFVFVSNEGAQAFDYPRCRDRCHQVSRQDPILGQKANPRVQCRRGELFFGGCNERCDYRCFEILECVVLQDQSDLTVLQSNNVELIQGVSPNICQTTSRPRLEEHSIALWLVRFPFAIASVGVREVHFATTAPTKPPD